MSSAGVNTLRAELTAAAGVFTPQLRGLREMDNDPFPQAVLDAINDQIAKLANLTAAIETALTALDGLDKASYPTLPPLEVTADVLAELTREKTDVESAVDNRFAPLPMASNIDINLGFPSPKVGV